MKQCYTIIMRGDFVFQLFKKKLKDEERIIKLAKENEKLKNKISKLEKKVLKEQGKKKIVKSKMKAKVKIAKAK